MFCISPFPFTSTRAQVPELVSQQMGLVFSVNIQVLGSSTPCYSLKAPRHKSHKGRDPDCPTQLPPVAWMPLQHSCLMAGWLHFAHTCHWQTIYDGSSWSVLFVKKVKVAQLCLTLCDPKDYTVHGILQARILE